MRVPDTAMVMAAGLGTRMRPLTNDRPKPLVSVGGKPLIDYSFDKLRLAGVRKAVVNIHYLPDMMVDYLEAGIDDLEIAISDERDLLLETGGGLVKALPMISADPFYAINSDAIWTDGDVDALTRLAESWDSERMDALLLLVPRENAHHHRGTGDFFLGDEGQLIRRGEHGSAPFVYTGVQLVSKRLLRDAPDGPFSTNVLWDRAIAEGEAFGLIHDGEWFDIGSPAAIPPTEEALLAHG
jgi:N-acetyl-alpha-D-muramate 1-phosphate uridylyltransferase